MCSAHLCVPSVETALALAQQARLVELDAQGRLAELQKELDKKNHEISKLRAERDGLVHSTTQSSHMLHQTSNIKHIKP